MNSYELLRSYLSIYDSFQSSKERLAYGATTLYVIGAATLLVQTPFWLGYSQVQFVALVLLLALSAVSGPLFVYWQLKYRRFAIRMFDACFSLSTRWLISPPNQDDLRYVEGDAGLLWPNALSAEFHRVAGHTLPGVKRFFDYIAYLAMIAWAAAALWRVIGTWLYANCYL